MNLPFLLCITLYLRAIFQVQAPGGGAYIWMGYLTEGFFCVTGLGGLYLEGLVHGGPYFRNFTVNYIMMGLIPTGTRCSPQNTKRLHLKFRQGTYVFPLTKRGPHISYPNSNESGIISFLFQEFSGNVNSFSLRFNHLNTLSQFQYIRFHPISFEQHPCMQVSVFGCVQG